MKLVRLEKRPDGIFSRLFNDNGVPIAWTLEHAYEQQDGSWAPKIPNGKFTCERGIHELHNLVPFETFEVTGVTGHTNILFHAGNFDKDSEGCILVGRAIATQADGTDMVTNSKQTFTDIMANLHGINEFTLTVEDAKPA